MSNFEWLNEDSRVFLERGYLSEGETPEQRIKDIADYAEDILGIEGFSDKFYNYMSKGFYSLSSPVWSNFGKGRGLSISCFGSYISDNIPSILNTIGEVGIMSKYGGGTSGYFGDIRPRGSEITDNGKTSGSVHFMKFFEQDTDTISQGNTRRGRFSPYLPIDHPDIEEFLEIGTEGNPIQNLTHAVTVTDDWLLDMVNGDTEKRRVWAKVLTRRTQLGYPYIFFHDNANNNTVDVYKDLGLTINNSNLCK
nr:MAG TPA: ribonucleotide-diphosphate reductase subunit alpha [Herelleviridae sp.]